MQCHQELKRGKIDGHIAKSGAGWFRRATLKPKRKFRPPSAKIHTWPGSSWRPSVIRVRLTSNKVIALPLVGATKAVVSVLFVRGTFVCGLSLRAPPAGSWAWVCRVTGGSYHSRPSKDDQSLKHASLLPLRRWPIPCPWISICCNFSSSCWSGGAGYSMVESDLTGRDASWIIPPKNKGNLQDRPLYCPAALGGPEGWLLSWCPLPLRPSRQPPCSLFPGQGVREGKDTYDPGRTRAYNPRLRGPMPYPLGHRTSCSIEALICRPSSILDVDDVCARPASIPGSISSEGTCSMTWAKSSLHGRGCTQGSKE